MMIIRQPLYIYPGDRLESELDRLRQLFSATEIKSSEPGPQLNNFFLLGPRTTRTAFQLLKYRGLTLKQPPNSTPIIAWGVWMPFEDNPLHAPLVQIYRPLPQSGDRPLLISEQPLLPGELMIVTEHSESLVTLSPCELTQTLPDNLQWFAWYSDLTRKTERPILCKNYPLIPQHQIPDTLLYHPGPTLLNPTPWLKNLSSKIPYQLTPQTSSFQIFSIVPGNELADLALALNAAPWTRQIQENSSHDTCNILAWSHHPDCPLIVKELVWQLQNPALKKKVAQLTGIPLITRRTLTCDRLRPGDRLFPGKNSPSDGKVRVQLHWILQVPHTPERPWDLRVRSLNAPDKPQTVYAAKPNSALCFLIGKDHSYEIPVIPKDATDRLSIMMTFESRVDPPTPIWDPTFRDSY
ncbi:hypothetical protein [Laspinema olomoucense]|uniref:hypothetical protein n=1 Tax=Laspinema olomoucense TaxID=3231600 RepID=UPI0021BB2687|nr:hypothetical protein [Laspinema sp. D3d]MCT7974466.1 hypothetical protein [Laspinema sp. D3d]